MKNYETGLNAEKLAITYLKGYEIIGHRIKTKFGEIDILAKKNNDFYIIEVKSRKKETTAMEALSQKQMKRCINAFFSFANANSINYSQIFIKLIIIVKEQIKMIDIDTLDFQENDIY